MYQRTTITIGIMDAEYQDQDRSASLYGMAAVKPTQEPSKGKLRTWGNKLRDKYRLMLINDSTFEERFSIRLTRMNVLLLAVAAFTIHGAFVTAVIVLTPLKQYIPGYSDQKTKMNAYKSVQMADSIADKLAVSDLYLQNLRMVLSGEVQADSAILVPPVKIPEPAELLPSKQDSALRRKQAKEEAYSLSEGKGTIDRRSLSSVFFFPPLRGIVTSKFEPGQEHYGIDIVANADAAVKACLDGTVIMSSWTTDGGHVLQVQHKFDLISVYKHNSVLLKKTGDRIRAGEAVAIVGNSGELTTGPHLHFELWLNGEPVDPQAYMVFQ